MVLQLIKQPYQLSFTGNSILYSFVCTPYTFIDRKEDYKIEIAILQGVANTTIFSEIKKETLLPDFYGQASIDISTIVDAYLNFFTPRLTQSVPFKVSGQTGKYKVTAKLFKADVQIGTTIVSNEFTAIKGGISYEKFSPTFFFENQLRLKAQPLHYWSQEQTLATDEKKYLTWINPWSTVSTQVINFLFHTYQLGDVLFSITVPQSPNVFDIYNVDISLQTLLNTFPFDAAWLNEFKNFTVQYVDIGISETAGGGISIVAPFRFFIDYKSNFKSYFTDWASLPNVRMTIPFSRTIAFTNSIGGFDTLQLLGEVESQAEYIATNAKITTPPGGISRALLQPQNHNFENFETEKFIGNTTFISQAKLESLRQLLLSTNVFEIKNEQLIPININKKTAKFFTNRDNLFSMALEWENSFANSYYTPNALINQSVTCPALDTFIVTQLSRNIYQVTWSMPDPYDILELQITDGTTAQTFTLYGNSGSQEITYMYPVNAFVVPLTITGRVICDPDSTPINAGAFTTLLLTAAQNFIPVANDDTFTIAAGYNTLQLLQGNVLANDYDVDNDAIECVPVTLAATTQGGQITITIDGKVSYKPPTVLFNGEDSFIYTIKQSNSLPGASITASANIKISVGNTQLGNALYAKLFHRNYREENGGNSIAIYEDRYIGFYADPAATIPKDTTGLGIVVFVKQVQTVTQNGNVTNNDTTNLSVQAVGTEVQFFSGRTIFHLFNPINTLVEINHTLLPGAGYIPV